MSHNALHSIEPSSCPDSAKRVLLALEEQGFEAWLVGGWVRDMLRGVTAHDVDICTDALWPQTKAALEAAQICVHETGTQHGTVTAVVEGEPIEVTTYRIDGTYSDSRHPDQVTFVRDIKEDLARRDFTINAMAWHPERGLLDVFDGESDLESGVIRAVGKPEKRFQEDALRVLRAIRFACRLGFSIEVHTQEALLTCTPLLAHIAQERIGQELRGICDSGRLSWALRHQQTTMCQVIPSLKALIGFNQQSQYHCFDIYEHTLRVVEGVECYTAGLASEHLRWAALLHDIGKPATFFVDEAGQGHFYGHPHEGAVMTQDYLHSLALPHDDIRTIVALVRLHDRPMNPTIPSVLSLLRDLDQKNKSASSAETLALMHEMLDLRRADALAKAPQCRSYATELDEHERILRTIETSNLCWRLDKLDLTGKDLIAAGVKPGPEIGELLARALDGVIAQKAPNDKDELLEYLNL